MTALSAQQVRAMFEAKDEARANALATAPRPCRVWEHVITATVVYGRESYVLCLDAQWTEGSPRDRYQVSVYWSGDPSEPIGTTTLHDQRDIAIGAAAALAYAHHEGLQEPNV